MKLEEQLAKLAEAGIALNEGITIDDLLYSFDRDAYESRPFDLVLFILGAEVEREPWGRDFCSRVWNFDSECILSSGDYTRIVKKLCVLSGDPDYLGEIEDYFDLESEEAWLKYTISGPEKKKRNWSVEVSDDWADMLTINYVMDDIERDGKKFYYKDNGQAMILFFSGPGHGGVYQ